MVSQVVSLKLNSQGVTDPDSWERVLSAEGTVTGWRGHRWPFPYARARRLFPTARCCFAKSLVLAMAEEMR